MTALPEMCPLCPRLCPHRSSLPPSLLPLQAARPPYRPCTQLPFQPKVVILTPVGKQAGALWGGAEGVLGDAVCRLTLGSAGRLPTCVWGVGGGPPRLPPHAALERGWLGWGPPSPHRWSLSSSGFTPAIGPEPPCLAAAGSIQATPERGSLLAPCRPAQPSACIPLYRLSGKNEECVFGLCRNAL